MHHALEIIELRERIVSFVHRSTLLPLARTSTLFNDLALQRFYEGISLTVSDEERLLASTLPLNAGSKVLSAKDCEAFLRVARFIRSIDRYYEVNLSNLPRIITRDSPILFPNLRSLSLDCKVEEVWYPPIQAYLPATLQSLSVKIRQWHDDRPVTVAQAALSSQQQRDFLKFLSEIPKADRFSLSNLYLERFSTSLDDETLSYLSSFICTQHKLASVRLCHVPLDLWPYIASLQDLQYLALDSYCLPSGPSTNEISFDTVSQLRVELDHVWQTPGDPVTGVTFTNIRKLSIYGPIGYLTSLTKAVQRCKLTKVVITIHGPWDVSTVNHLLRSLHSEASIESLEDFIWNMRPNTGMVPVPFTAFQPILKFTHISHLLVYCEGSGGGVDLNDDNVALLADAFPNLEDIFFGPSFDLPHVTLHGLGHFTKCSKLRSMRFSFRPILLSGIPRPAKSSKVQHIKQFKMVYSFREDELVVQDAVEFLDAVFPDLELLNCPSEDIIWPALLDYRLTKTSSQLDIQE
ncbi:hypothetical protein DL96DRAFT_1771598 [Flagelloscypha sp. PMI_526]|nr:hypothetical protein DL96DRAFT_1771598 [Flagelloscypha sp. PMI_526]